MSKNNPVYQVMVTKGNQAILGEGRRIFDLAPGQIGVFDAETNVSISQNSDKPRNYFFAVGLDRDSDGQTDDVVKSRGSHIQIGNITSYTYRPHTPGRAMKVKFKNYTAECDNEYGVKIQIKNAEIYRIQGYNSFVKTYVTKTECCGNCKQPCDAGDSNIITKNIFIQVKNDPSGLLKVVAIPREGSDVNTAGVTFNGTSLTVEDLDKIIEYNKKQTSVDKHILTDLEFETVPIKIAKACGINLNHFYPRESIAFLSKVGDFNCSGEIEVTQEPIFEEGNGYDLAENEYFTQGWDVSPYRVSSVTGLEVSREYNVDKSEKYDQIHLAYEQKSDGAWLKYSYDEATTIAIPAKDTVTRDGLLAILDNLNIVRFDALLDDAQSANTDPSVVETTSKKNDVKKDGLA